MTISNMALPDEAIKKACEAYYNEPGASVEGMRAAIRAYLQAMLNCGMAGIAVQPGTAGKVLIIRLDADERKREEQT